MANFYYFAVPQWLTSSGAPLNAGTIDFYQAGTSTRQDTFTDSTGGTANANPVVLDSAGRAQIWLSAASYKFVVKTSGGSTLLTVDNFDPSFVASSASSVTSTGNVTMQKSTAATSGANQSSNTFEIDANYWDGSQTQTDKWQITDTLGTGSNPTNTLTLAHSGSTGQSAVRIPAAIPLEFSTDSAVSRGGANKLQVGVTTGTPDNSGTVDATEYLVAGVASSGTGALARVTGAALASPVLTTPTLGDATATTINKVTITAPATGATLALANNSNVTGPSGTVQLVGRATTDNLTNKTMNGASSGNAVNLLNAQGPASAIVGTGADATVFTYTIPAGTIGAGKGIRVRAVVQHTTGTAAVSYKLKLGSTTLLTSAHTDSATSTLSYYFDIFNAAGVQNSQYGAVMSFENTAFAEDVVFTASENTANALALTFTFNVANTDQVTPKFWLVELIQ